MLIESMIIGHTYCNFKVTTFMTIGHYNHCFYMTIGHYYCDLHYETEKSRHSRSDVETLLHQPRNLCGCT